MMLSLVTGIVSLIAAILGLFTAFVTYRSTSRSPNRKKEEDALPPSRPLQTLGNADLIKLADMLTKSGRASHARREAFCDEIDVDFNNLDFLEQAPSDFALRLVKHLKSAGHTKTLLQICEVIAPDLGDELNNELSTIQAKLKLEAKLELEAPVRELIVPRIKAKFLIILISALIISGLVTLIVLGVRWTGILQRYELPALDFLMQRRPPESVDSYVSIVGITGGEIISDERLLALIKKINRYKPTLLGLDVYRDKPTGSQKVYSDLITYLKNHDNVIASCLLNPKNENAPGSGRIYSEIPPVQLGYTDVWMDSHEVIRRHLLYVPAQKNSPCKTTFSFSFRLALNYLQSLNPPIYPENFNNRFKIHNTIFTPLKERIGGYQDPDKNLTTDGFQILLNYRSPKSDSNTPTFPTYKVFEVLDEYFTPSEKSHIEDRVVIIGYISLKPNENRDAYSTPYGYHGDKKMPGVLIHANMVSQILNAVLKDRPLLLTYSWEIDALWIWFWSLVGCGIAWLGYEISRLCHYKSVVIQILLIIAALAFLYYFCLQFLQIISKWIPLIPPLIALILGFIVLHAAFYIPYIKRKI